MKRTLIQSHIHNAHLLAYKEIQKAFDKCWFVQQNIEIPELGISLNKDYKGKYNLTYKVKNTKIRLNTVTKK